MKYKSIITNEQNKCFLCGSVYWIEIHHIFGSANRKNSTKYGLVVPLCHHCHNEPPHGVHFNKARNESLKKLGQERFIKAYPNLDFIKIFKKNYI